jgi:AcrR family transcriptional regulator
MSDLIGPATDRTSSTLERIKDAAERVLRTIGRDRFTTQDVAREAGLSLGTIYRYFPSRAALLDFVWPDRSDSYLL